MHLTKTLRLPQVAIILCGILLVLVALPFFYRFTATAVDHGHLSNILAGVTGMIGSLSGLPLMVTALHRQRLLEIIEQIEDCPAGRWFFGIMLVIAPGQFAWYLFWEAHLPRCTGSQFSFGYCFPVYVVMFVSVIFALVTLMNTAWEFIIKPRLEPRKQSQ